MLLSRITGRLIRKYTIYGSICQNCERQWQTLALSTRPPERTEQRQPKFKSVGMVIASSLLGYYLINNREKMSTVKPIVPTVFAASSMGKVNLFPDNPKDDSTPSDNGKGSNNGSYRAKFNFLADAVEKVVDSVVLIEVKNYRVRDLGGAASAVIAGPGFMSNGSGFIIQEDGLILTNAHVVANNPRTTTINVRLSNGEECEGFLEELDSNSDLALIRINKTGLKPARFGTVKDLRLGEFVVALGSPLNLKNSITSGVVSSVGRPSKELGFRRRNIDYIQTDAAITFGNSGGPLINLDGEVIGITSMKIAAASNISFAIPSDHAKLFIEKASKKKEFMESKQCHRKYRRRYLGVTMWSLHDAILNQMKDAPESNVKIPSIVTHGVFILRSVVGSPADRAGIVPGDIITHVNGQAIHDVKEIFSILEGEEDLRMVVVRNGQRYSVTVSPEK